MNKEFGDIANSEPINQTARLVVEPSKDNFDHKASNLYLENFDTEMPIEYFLNANLGRKKARHRQSKVLRKIIGKTIGRVTVMGVPTRYFQKKTGGSLFVARCACGYWITRCTFFFTDQNRKDQCCSRCDVTKKLRKKADWISGGKKERPNT